MLRYFFSPSPSAKAARYLDRIEKDQDYYRVYLKGYERPLYFPSNNPEYIIKTGITEICDPDDFHFYEIPETAVGKDDVVVDCGAAEGFFTYLAAGRCRHVYAMEPLPSFAKGLRQTFQGVENVTIVESAMSDMVGEVCFQENGIASMIASEGTRISCQTIDSFFYDKDIPIHYLKADIEGAESKMLAGAAKTIARYRPKMAITVYHIGNDEFEIKRQILAMCPDYKIRIKGMIMGGKPMMLHAWV